MSCAIPDEARAFYHSKIPKDAFWDSGVRNGWPWYVAAREQGVRFPLSPTLFWTFDEISRQAVLWGLKEGPPSTIYIEMPPRIAVRARTRRRTEAVKARRHRADRHTASATERSDWRSAGVASIAERCFVVALLRPDRSNAARDNT
jgi:hypothetical protein